MTVARLSLKDATALASAVLTTAGTDMAAAFATAAALVAADADGIGSHGLSRLPAYAGQVLSGKVDGRAVPALEWTGQGSLQGGRLQRLRLSGHRARARCGRVQGGPGQASWRWRSATRTMPA